MLGDEKSELDSGATDGAAEDVSNTCAVELASTKLLDDVDCDEGAVVEMAPPSTIVLDAYAELVSSVEDEGLSLGLRVEEEKESSVLEVERTA